MALLAHRWSFLCNISPQGSASWFMEVFPNRVNMRQISCSKTVCESCLRTSVTISPKLVSPEHHPALRHWVLSAWPQDSQPLQPLPFLLSDYLGLAVLVVHSSTIYQIEEQGVKTVSVCWWH